MGLGIRIFIVDDDESLHRLPLTRFQRLLDADSDECLPQYSGKQMRCAMVVLDVSGRKPLHIKHIDYLVLHFDSNGRFDRNALIRETRLAFECFSPLSKSDLTDSLIDDSLIDARNYFSKKRYENEFKWKPTPGIDRAIKNAIFKDSSR